MKSLLLGFQPKRWPSCRLIRIRNLKSWCHGLVRRQLLYSSNLSCRQKFTTFMIWISVGKTRRFRNSQPGKKPLSRYKQSTSTLITVNNLPTRAALCVIISRFPRHRSKNLRSSWRRAVVFPYQSFNNRSTMVVLAMAWSILKVSSKSEC